MAVVKMDVSRRGEEGGVRGRGWGQEGGRGRGRGMDELFTNTRCSYSGLRPAGLPGLGNSSQVTCRGGEMVPSASHTRTPRSGEFI